MSGNACNFSEYHTVNLINIHLKTKKLLVIVVIKTRQEKWRTKCALKPGSHLRHNGKVTQTKQVPCFDVLCL